MELQQLLKDGIQKFGVELSDTQVEQFNIYKKLLVEWNNKINLTAITDDVGIIKKHFVDSASIISSQLIKANSKIIDVGTGAGFPGIPIKILMPDTDITLLDALNKRVKFLNTIIEELDLKGIRTEHGRAEEMSRNKNFREKFDIATARAVANMNLLSEFCMPYVKKGGFFIAMKGPSGYEELENAKNAIRILGGKERKIVETEILGEEMKHNLVIIEKVSTTSALYPRRYAIIEKNQL
jgi:16S rRNA (guanine527-N7)-methyltransferase